MSQNLFDIQYRMHPSIAASPNQKFYDGKVGDGSNVHKHVRPQGVAWPCSSHNVFINVRADESRRFENKASARLILRIWKRILQQNNYNQDNMVILTGYNSQKRLYKELIAGDSSLRGGVVMTVDSFQGQESGVVFFDTVRSNPQRDIGFLKEEERVNVALTRAKAALIIVGNCETLVRGDNYGLWEYLLSNIRFLDEKEQEYVPDLDWRREDQRKNDIVPRVRRVKAPTEWHVEKHCVSADVTLDPARILLHFNAVVQSFLAVAASPIVLRPTCWRSLQPSPPQLSQQ